MKPALFALSALACLAGPPAPAPDQIQLTLTYSESNGASGPSGLFGDFVSSIFLTSGGAVGLLDGLSGLGRRLEGGRLPQTSGEVGRLLSSPRGLHIAAMAPRRSGYQGRIQAWLQWDEGTRAYQVRSGTLVWTADNHSRWQSGNDLQTSNLSAGGTHTLQPGEVTVAFSTGKAEALRGGKGTGDTTYTLTLEVAPKGEPIIGDSGWISGGGGVFEAHAKYTTGSVELRGTKDYKPAPGGSDLVAKPPEHWETKPAELYQHPLRYSAEERTLQGRGGTFAETWVDATGTTHAVSWQLGLPEPSVEITKLEQEGGPRTGDASQLVFEEGTLRFKATAQVRPFHEAEALRWEAPRLGASEPRIEQVVKEGGVVEATVTYQGLPAENSAFGSKTLRARVQQAQDEERFQVFFRERGRDNPEGERLPNWYYYWRQGAVPQLDRFAYEDDVTKAGGYSPANKRLVVTSESVGVIPALDVVLDHSHPISGNHTYHLQRTRRERLEAVGAIVAHELKHKELFETAGPDYDLDGVRDAVEEGSGSPWLDMTSPRTYGNFTVRTFFGDPEDYKRNGAEGTVESRTKAVEEAERQLGIVGDNELLAIIAEKGLVVRKAQDWAFPGSQATAR